VQVTIRLLLERAGHAVVTAGDGRKGLDLVAQENFDLLFLDIFMPGMDGFLLASSAAELKPDMPILFHCCPKQDRVVMSPVETEGLER
jgi:CheY-like chemotaxis protein